MARATAVFSLLCLTASAIGAEKKPKQKWLKNYGQALSQARKAGKPLLIVLDVPKEPRKRVEQVSLSRDKANEALLSPYVLCHVDVTTRYGKKVAAAFEVKSFPHTAVIDREGRSIIYSHSGSYTTKDWAHTLVTYRKGVWLGVETTVLDRQYRYKRRVVCRT